ncbi:MULTISPECIES: amino acid ABC transporter ATP-binding protein [Bacillaceae]|uniref:Polar amino acid ABC transporter ATP-binding protein n=1 Tax=Domibacillus aminovorans TaxID=29332 RepID=A0A177KNT4_9BACI|nr:MULTISPECIES: amino acid ABC transporter ATP-binding protein [Bacillaceae]OAH54646.1 polar amino acid ABC transporter ATP-binding protein [Domibacillus aminovorans]
MIKMYGISKHFQDNEVLKEINMEVANREIVAVLGPSGSGKSTLLRCINGLEEISSGRMDVNGTMVDAAASKKTRQKNVQAIRLQTGMVFQQFNLYPHKTVIDNVIEALITVKKTPKEKAVQKGETLLKRVGLMDKRNVYPSRLSGGQQQRVAIARALAMEPAIMLFDEPTSALDPELVGEVLSVMRELANEGMTMMIVTHEMKFAREVADRILFMADGRIVEDAAPAQFFSSPQSERAKKFLHQVMDN